MPAALNLTDCPFVWPYCRQPLYAGAMPVIFNATVLNGMGLTGRLGPEKGPTFRDFLSVGRAGGQYSRVWRFIGHHHSMAAAVMSASVRPAPHLPLCAGAMLWSSLMPPWSTAWA